jgi:hypothetical protein
VVIDVVEQASLLLAYRYRNSSTKNDDDDESSH